MSAEYAPGTVVKAYFHNGGPLPGGDVIALRSGHGWHVVPLTPHHVSCFVADDASEGVTLTDVRPLVVLDLTQFQKGPYNYPEFLRGLAKRDPMGTQNSGQWGGPQRGFARWIADQIEAQTKPPGIPEPGVWGVVEAKVAGGDPIRVYKYVRNPDGYWYTMRGAQRQWSELVDPTLIREGVSDDA